MSTLSSDVRASLLLLGSTDLTLAIASGLLDAGVPLAAVCSAPAEFRISYSQVAVHNSRYVDMSGWCRDRGIVFRPYNAPDDIAEAASHTGAAAALAAGWYHMVPRRVRASLPRGCFGVHASLLPRYRGGAPLNWALLNGDAETGVSLFELTDGVDDGMLYDQKRFEIAPDDYIGDLLKKAETVTLAMATETVPRLLNGSVEGRAQLGVASYTLQRQPSDAAIDWRRPAADIARLIRSASRPYSGARTAFDGKPLIIWRARPAEQTPVVHGVPGQIVRLRELPSPAVVTGAGLLLVEEVEGLEGFDLDAFARSHQKRLSCYIA